MDSKSVSNEMMRGRLGEVEDVGCAGSDHGGDLVRKAFLVDTDLGVELSQPCCLRAGRIEADLSLEDSARLSADAQGMELLDGILTQAASSVGKHLTELAGATVLVQPRLDSEGQQHSLDLKEQL